MFFQILEMLFTCGLEYATESNKQVLIQYLERLNCFRDLNLEISFIEFRDLKITEFCLYVARKGDVDNLTILVTENIFLSDKKYAHKKI